MVSDITTDTSRAWPVRATTSRVCMTARIAATHLQHTPGARPGIDEVAMRLRASVNADSKQLWVDRRRAAIPDQIERGPAAPLRLCRQAVHRVWQGRDGVCMCLTLDPAAEEM